MWRCVGLAVLVVACRFEQGRGEQLGSPDDGSVDPTRDGGGPVDDAGRVDATSPLGPWSAPTQIVLSGTGGDDDPCLTNDLLELYFNRSGDVYVSRRAAPNMPWGTPARVAGLSTNDPETTPEVTRNGTTAFVATRTSGDYDVYTATRTGTNSWSPLTLVGSLSSSNLDNGATPSDDLLEILLVSDRHDPGNRFQLFGSTRASTSAAWSSPVLMTALNDSASMNDSNPMLTSDRLAVYFGSDRLGHYELFVATRASTSAPFGAPQRITELGTADDENDPWISSDGRTIVFTRLIGSTSTLWMSTR